MESECIHRAGTPSSAVCFTLINLANETPVNPHNVCPHTAAVPRGPGGEPGALREGPEWCNRGFLLGSVSMRSDVFRRGSRPARGEAALQEKRLYFRARGKRPLLGMLLGKVRAVCLHSAARLSPLRLRCAIAFTKRFGRPSGRL